VKAILGIFLCIILFFFLVMGRREKKRYKNLRKKIVDRAKGRVFDSVDYPENVLDLNVDDIEPEENSDTVQDNTTN